MIRVLPFLNNPKDLDPCYKRNLDFSDCSGRKKVCLITEEIWYFSASLQSAVFAKLKFNFVLEFSEHSKTVICRASWLFCKVFQVGPRSAVSSTYFH